MIDSILVSLLVTYLAIAIIVYGGTIASIWESEEMLIFKLLAIPIGIVPSLLWLPVYIWQEIENG